MLAKPYFNSLKSYSSGYVASQIYVCKNLLTNVGFERNVAALFPVAAVGEDEKINR